MLNAVFSLELEVLMIYCALSISSLCGKRKGKNQAFPNDRQD